MITPDLTKNEQSSSLVALCPNGITVGDQLRKNPDMHRQHLIFERVDLLKWLPQCLISLIYARKISSLFVEAALLNFICRRIRAHSAA